MAHTVFCKIIKKSLDLGPDIKDVTHDVEALIKESGVTEGLLQMNVIGSTGSITTIEYEPGVVEDLKDAINRLAPKDLVYKHELAWHDGNGHSHVQAALLGPSVAIAIRDGRLMLGTWQQIVVINHDNRPRKRKIACTVIGVSKR